ncbi:hypothetical protein E2C01_012317 [Portunus trituberculatus]|uniref:Uncharacterized protein n=1 Tax=Portunus trituberculatus TaxID=210409 RepID=A0A5B7DDQ9_PORTR|nr:hypothetical protein [Portunus trituberculatus]
MCFFPVSKQPPSSHAHTPSAGHALAIRFHCMRLSGRRWSCRPLSGSRAPFKMAQMATNHPRHPPLPPFPLSLRRKNECPCGFNWVWCSVVMVWWSGVRLPYPITPSAFLTITTITIITTAAITTQASLPQS